MTEAVIRRWLLTHPGLTSLVDDRVATHIVPSEGFPAVQIGRFATNPLSDATAQVDHIYECQFVLYVHGGRLTAGGSSGFPNQSAAQAVSAEIVKAVRSVQASQWVDAETSHKFLRMQIVSNASGVDPDTNGARRTISVSALVA